MNNSGASLFLCAAKRAITKRAALVPASPGRGLVLKLRCTVLFLIALLAPACFAAQTSASSSATRKSRSAGQKKSLSRKKQLTAAQRRARSQRAQRARRAFVASSDLRPMAQQLLEARGPAAYAGVESWARKHASTDAGSLAWLVAG